ncbi:MAG: GntR family transcriptional regulator [Rhodocyclaceae bacterium]
MRHQSRAIDIPRSLTEIVEENIRQMILNGDLELGEQISESKLSEIFSLSKTPIREALLRLSAGERLIEIKPRCGSFVFSLTEKEITDIAMVRIMLEQGAIRAAMHADRTALLSDLERNLNACESLRQKLDLTAYRKLDHRFHRIFVEHARNPYLSDMHSTITTKVLAMRNRLTFSQEYVHNSIGEHAQMYEALLEENVEKACRVVQSHIHNGFTERARRLLSQT